VFDARAPILDLIVRIKRFPLISNDEPGASSFVDICIAPNYMFTYVHTSTSTASPLVPLEFSQSLRIHITYVAALTTQIFFLVVQELREYEGALQELSL